MTGKDDRGRFVPGNGYASAGGRARAAKLTPAERRRIARKGWQGFVTRRFGGDVIGAKSWLSRLGRWAANRAYEGSAIYHGDLWPHPGPCPRGGAR